MLSPTAELGAGASAIGGQLSLDGETGQVIPQENGVLQERAAAG